MQKLVDRTGLKDCYGIAFSAVHLARLMKTNRFPQALKPTGVANGRLFWRTSDIEAWIERNGAEQQGEQS